MDFLNKLKHGDDESASSSHHDGKPDFLAKLTGPSKEEREKKARELAAREAEIQGKLDAVAKEREEHAGFFHKLGDALDKDGAAEKAKALDEREAVLRAELEAVAREKREEEGVLERLKDKFDGDDDEEEEGRVKKVVEKEEHGVSGFFHKLSGREEEEERLREEDAARKRKEEHGLGGLMDKITGKEEEEERRRKEEENKGALEKMQDKINESMGGGRKAEEKEDFLDKSEFSHTLHPWPVWSVFANACVCV